MSTFKYAIALTGGIGTGKSSVVKILKQRGFDIIDADNVAHKILDEQVEKIEILFGHSFVKDGQVDRKALGKLIFSNENKRLELEQLLHPLIYKDIELKASELDLKKKVYIVDIPLFFENGNYPIDRSILIYAKKELQVERLMKRDGRDLKSALERINSQMSFVSKKNKATYIIDNNSDFSHLEIEVDRVINLIKKIKF